MNIPLFRKEFSKLKKRRKWKNPPAPHFAFRGDENSLQTVCCGTVFRASCKRLQMRVINRLIFLGDRHEFQERLAAETSRIQSFHSCCLNLSGGPDVSLERGQSQNMVRPAAMACWQQLHSDGRHQRT